jgi:hypothetical protein
MSGMARRLIAVLGILALAMTFLTSVSTLASAEPNCCNGIMCPMHEAQSHPSCDMGANGSGCALKCLPGQPVSRFVATIVFALFAPVTLQHDFACERAIEFLAHLSPDALPRVDSPPPRFLLSA